MNLSFDGKNYALQFRNTKDDLTLVDVYIDNILIQSGAMCVPDAPIIKYNYLTQGGNFYFHCLNYDYPNYKQFGVTQTLYYLSDGEKYPFDNKNQELYEQTIKYIEGTGTQYLDTGVVADVNTEMELVVVPTSSYAYLGGSIDAINTRQYGINLSSNGQITLYYGTVSSPAYTKQGGSWVVGTPTTLKIGAGGKLSQDGTVVVDYTNDPNVQKEFSASTIRLFYFFGSFGAFRLRYCKIWQSGILVRNMIPVLDLNGVPCMYDQITGRFFRNVGTSVFLYG